MTPNEIFVGRGSELRVLQGLLAAAEGSTSCVTGPAGIGKTRFAEQVANWADQHGGFRTVWARCWDGPGTPALWPWGRLLEQLSGPEAKDVLELEVRITGGRFSQYEAVADRLLEQSQSGRLLLIIDDIHWADPASLQLIKFLARDRRNDRLHLLTTMRPPEASQGPNAELIKDIEREAVRVELPGLTNAEIAVILEDADEQVVALLAEQTGGNPFFLLEIARVLRARGQLSDAIDPALVTSPSVRSVINNHLALVSRGTRELLAVAAVQGRDFDGRVAGHAIGATELQLEHRLREAADSNLIERLGDGQARFEHALIGETLVGSLAPNQRAQAHLATVDATEALHGLTETRLAGTATNHLFAAGSLVSSERLLLAASTAASYAGTQLAWEDQSHFLSIAEHAVRSNGAASDSRLVAVMIERINAAKQQRDLEQAQSIGLGAARTARHIDDPVAFGQVALAFPPDIYAVEIDEDYNPDQRRLREEALQRLEGVAGQDALRSRLQATLALSLYWETPTGDRATSHRRSASRREDLTIEALSTARSLNDPVTLAIALNARVHANWGPAIRSERSELAEELIGIGHEMDDAAIALSGRVWRIAKLFEIGELAEAEREVQAFQITALQIQDRVHLWTAARWRATIAFFKGDLALTSTLLDESLDLGSQIMDPESAFLFYSTTLSTLYFLRCEFDQLLGYLVQNVEEKPLVPAWRAGLAIASAETGDLKGARDQLEVLCSDDFAFLPRDLNFLPTLVVLALVSLHVRDVEFGLAIHQQLLAYSDGWAIYGTGYAVTGHVTVALGHTAEASGQHDLAKSYYRTAITDIDSTNSPHRATTRVSLASLIARTEPEAAIDLLEQAEAIFVNAGLDVRASRAKAMLLDLTQQLAVCLEQSPQGWMLHKAGGNAINLGELKGIKALAALLSRPNQDTHVLDLVALLEGQANALAPDQSIEVLDAEARKQYVDRLTELQLLLDRADVDGDERTSERLSRESEMIESQLSNASWMGRSRFSQSNADRARVSVTKLIKRSIAHVSALDPAIGRHLNDYVETGMHCAYRPADTPITWTVRS